MFALRALGLLLVLGFLGGIAMAAPALDVVDPTSSSAPVEIVEDLEPDPEAIVVTVKAEPRRQPHAASIVVIAFVPQSRADSPALPPPKR